MHTKLRNAARPINSMTTTEKHVLELIAKFSYKYSETPFELSSGSYSNHYIDLRPLVLTPAGAKMLGILLSGKVERVRPSIVSGPELGAVPLVSYILGNYSSSLPYLRGCIIRKEPKEHGTKGLFFGNPPQETDTVLMIEDVITTGKSVLRSIEIVQGTGATVVGVLSVVDRQEDGRNLIEDLGIPTDTVFTLSQIVDYYNI